MKRKKLWIALLSAGLIFAFSMTASAVDVTVSGSYIAHGFYQSNPSLFDSGSYENAALFNRLVGVNTALNRYGYYSNSATNIYGYAGSSAWITQRLRVQTELKVVEGLSLITRFDALERTWGETRWAGGTSPTASRAAAGAAVTGAGGVGENIEFERAYAQFKTGIGLFTVGYQPFGTFGTVMADTSKTQAGIGYYIPVGPVTGVIKFGRLVEGITVAANNPANQYGGPGDVDSDEYDFGVIYKAQGIEAGALYQFVRNASGRVAPTVSVGGVPQDAGTLTKIHVFDPYFKGTFGPVYVEFEAIYGVAKTEFENNGLALNAITPTGLRAGNPFVGDVSWQQYGWHLQGQVNLGMFYVGGVFDMASGDDPYTLDKREGSLVKLLRAGDDYNPCLIMWNTWLTSTSVPIGMNLVGAAGTGYTIAAVNNDIATFFDNAWMYQIFFGVKPMGNKLDIKLALTYAYADQKPSADVRYIPDPYGGSAGPGYANPVNPIFSSNKYGWEADLTVDYKIYDNLTYTVGAAYHWVGDYFKGPDYTAFYALNGINLTEPKLANNYLLMHRLTLSF